jgi:hypothetical protein
MTQDMVLPIVSVPCGITPGPIELRRVETFTGAACCKTIELQSYKAAPLQGCGALRQRWGRSIWQKLDSSSLLLLSECRQSYTLDDTGLYPVDVQFQGSICGLEERVGTVGEGDLEVAWTLGGVLQL